MFQPMVLGVGLHEILWLAIATLVGGAVSGLLAGMLGVGGGSLLVPVLYEAFRLADVPEDV
ncbi:MAG TPA: sulfite exporter TauE/SafE family protein, partial [Xanthobacteraceae bacterium]|nr:sulfite exporter TauE/SafE family protein [Xanthobacteraceae bacterium]